MPNGLVFESQSLVKLIVELPTMLLGKPRCYRYPTGSIQCLAFSSILASTSGMEFGMPDSGDFILLNLYRLHSPCTTRVQFGGPPWIWVFLELQLATMVLPLKIIQKPELVQNWLWHSLVFISCPAS